MKNGRKGTHEGRQKVTHRFEPAKTRTETQIEHPSTMSPASNTSKVTLRCGAVPRGAVPRGAVPRGAKVGRVAPKSRKVEGRTLEAANRP